VTGQNTKKLGEEEAKTLYERMVTLEGEAEAHNQQLQAIQEQLRTVRQTIATIEELSSSTRPRETWIPIAPGAFVKGIVEPAQSVLLAVGAGAAVEKPYADVLVTLREHETTLNELAQGAVEELRVAHQAMERIKERVENTTAPVPPFPPPDKRDHTPEPGSEHHQKRH
jgi:prefoldin alpha subunit